MADGRHYYHCDECKNYVTNCKHSKNKTILELFKVKPKPPYCSGCGVIIPRTGDYCLGCRIEKGYESDDCTCYSNCPEECKSKLEHNCCCTNTFDTANCLATEHDCCCTDTSDIADCLATEHD
jgi:hypothetical protein